MVRWNLVLAVGSIVLSAGPACHAATAARLATATVHVGGPVHAIRTVGSQAFVAAGKGGVSVVELPSGRVVQKIAVPGDAIGVDVDFILSCGWLVRKIAVLTEGSVHVIDPRTFVVTRSFPVPQGSRDLKISHDRAVLFTAGNKLTAFELESGRKAWELQIMAVPGGFVIRDRHVLFAHGYPGGLKVIDVESGRVTADHRTTWLTGIDEIDGIAYATTSFGDGVQAIEVATGRVAGTVKDQAGAVAVDRRFLVMTTALSPMRIDVVERPTLRIIRQLPGDERSRVIAIGDGVALLGTDGGALVLIDLDRLEGDGARP
jgi:hypothetical protein